jgi:hypothetical protein
MNERIKQLAEQVGAVRNVLAMGRHDGVLFTEFELEKFAELIVRECMDNLEWHGHDEAVSQLEWLKVNRLGIK